MRAQWRRYQEKVNGYGSDYSVQAEMDAAVMRYCVASMLVCGQQLEQLAMCEGLSGQWSQPLHRVVRDLARLAVRPRVLICERTFFA